MSLLLSSAVSFYPQVHAAELEIALSPESVRFDFAQNSSGIGVGNGDITLGLLINDDDGYAAMAGLLVTGKPAGETPFSFGLGIRLYGGEAEDVNNDDQTFVAMTIGGRAEFTIPANTPMSIVGETFFAPDITTLADAGYLLDLNVRYEVEFIPQTAAFIGYRLFNVDFKSTDDVNVDDNFQVGIRLNF